MERFASRLSTTRLEAFSDVHHWVVGSIRYVDTAILRLNLVPLMLIAFLPFPTGLMGRFPHGSGPERVATIFYGLALLVTKGALAGCGGTRAGTGSF
jgi:uncharacterized membrane protein